MSHDHHSHHHDHLPCLHCYPDSYIRMVQHLIERCLLLRMTQDDCIEALANHASIQPLITLTVWKELIKENRGFFQTYHPAISPEPFNCETNKPLISSTGRPSQRFPRFRTRNPRHNMK